MGHTSFNLELCRLEQGFLSVAKPDLYSAMLMVKRTKQALLGLVCAGKGSIWWGSFVVLGGKLGDQKTYFVIMQDNFNALYRRHLASSSITGYRRH